MLEYSKILDISDEFCDVHQTLENASPDAGNAGGGVPMVTVVGQEQDGTAVCVWTAPSHTQSKSDVTYVGLYRNHKKLKKVIYEHESEIEIVNATTNAEHTFLGFVTVEQQDVSGPLGSRYKQDVYKAYVAEILPQGRVFYLNLERTAYIKLQFLYGDFRPQVAHRETHLMVILHRESIGLYHLPVSRAGDSVVLSDEPKKDQILRTKFTWVQWAAARQCLYVLYHRRHSTRSTWQGSEDLSSSLPIQPAASHHPVLVAYQFSHSLSPEIVFEIPLDLPVPFTHSTRLEYLPPGPYHTIPDVSTNMTVLTQPSGALCVCYQHPQVINSSEGIQYSMLIIHHRKVLHSHCTNLPTHIAMAADRHIHFAWQGDYVLAHLPGIFTHLLNVGGTTEPTNHIVYTHTGPMLSPVEQYLVNNSQSGQLVPFMNLNKKLAQHTAPCVCAAAGGCVYKLCISEASLLQQFRLYTDLDSRLSVIHFAAVHAHDLQLTRKIFEVACESATDLVLPHLLEEFILGSCYAAMKSVADAVVLRYLPITTVPAYRGLRQQCKFSKMLTSISYTSMDPVAIEAKITGISLDSLWENLANQMLLNAVGSKKSRQRFDLYNVRETRESMRQTDGIDADPRTHTVYENSTNFVASNYASKTSPSGWGRSVSPSHPTSPSSGSGSNYPAQPHSPTTSEAVLGKLPRFLEGPLDILHSSEPALCLITSELLTNHVLRYCRNESRHKVLSMVQEYIVSQLSKGQL